MLSTYSQPQIIVTFCQNICLKESKKEVSKVTQMGDRVASSHTTMETPGSNIQEVLQR